MPKSKWHPNMRVIAPLLSVLYETLGEDCGGLAHVVVPNPQSPIPNPQSPIPNPQFKFNYSNFKFYKYY